MTQSKPNRPLQVLQLTDPHLMADPHGELLGVNTRDSLDAVIAQVQVDGREPDLILATGDLAQDSSAEAYQVLTERLAQFACPALWLPGNHDDAVVLGHAAGAVGGQKQLVMGGWQFLLLDSSVPGHVHGELSDRELAFLERALARSPELPTMIALHHHPVDVGSRWMDNIGLRNRDAFWAIVDRFPQVRVVLWGHIHQPLDQQRGDVRLLASPSTCIQFAAGSADFAVADLAPGYRWFELHPDGALATDVVRAENFEFSIDLDSTGY
ncbi:3',5'-cyclic-AMP phosphodiesterase [Marinobacter xestospongiae]|uniref:3',5'-cyclic-AMP phosphodiesterase n=1 Tax=Marinobacter xestospongiae TaxID=994319 RepID=UPI0020054202|nr:3',5'-cyclic-AMP phosphodiesterase [Marinobacter xestospongiae]MCK7568290.1 3',5'-cyclic-AMP phosphodiesterase [Marinobacter xestospongiae]